jgi:outer membrane protein OmpA-like peptidoglycan-associated protein
MKILVIGFLAFSGWSAFSTYFYVCKIKELCDDPMALQMDKVIIADDTLSKSTRQETLEIPKESNIYFAFDKSEFNSDANTNKFFKESMTYLDQNIQTRLSIVGYTDSVGSDEYNQALGFRRAQSIQQYLENKGILINRITIESRGEKEPADDNNTAAGRANNRRTTITIKK